MAIFDKGYLWFVMLSFVTLVISVGMLLSADTSTDNALKGATEQAMYAGVSKGCLRVDENIVLDEAIVKNTFRNTYEQLTDYEDGITDLYIHQFENYAPMLATESRQTINTPFTRWMNGLNKEDKSDENSVRAFEVAIFEATSIQKPNSAEGLGNNGNVNEVDNFQCN